MKKIYLLTDYNGRFGSKANSIPYRSGMDQKLLTFYFNKQDFEPIFLNFSKVHDLKELKDILILYTSTEDYGYYYKSFIEDVVLYLQNKGAKIIPRYEFLRANNNKSFMELFRTTFNSLIINNILSWSFGSLEELKDNITKFRFPIVIKEAAGAMSKGVYLARDQKELLKIVKKISLTSSWAHDLKDFLRPLRHLQYKRQSVYRKKYIIQEFIPKLKNDWKVLVFYDNIFVLERGIKENDFRASGSKYNYFAGSKTEFPEGFLNYALSARNELNVPNVSLDIIYDGLNFKLIEFQAIYFGTSTIDMSDIYYQKINNGWEKTEISVNDNVEGFYVDSVLRYVKNDI
jgi:glutathione synthase/RimK-type ligase-like ATP-grasp enzyme